MDRYVNTLDSDWYKQRIVGVSFCVEPGHAAYVPLAHTYPGAPDQLNRAAVLAKLKPLLEDASLPKLGERVDRLRVIPGTVPNPARFPDGCRFHPRCAVMIERCLQDPSLEAIADGHLSRCWRAREIAAGTLDPVPPPVETVT